MQVILTIGYRKALRTKDGQLIRAYINNDEVSRKEGEYLHDRTVPGQAWYLAVRDIPPESEIKVSVKTGIVGIGTDENRTFEMVFIANPNAELIEVKSPLLGYKNHPIIKGRLIQTSHISEADKRQQKIYTLECPDTDWK